MTTRRLTDTHDMSFGSGLGSFATGAEEVAQNVMTRLYLLQGEWFLDIEDGVPYLQRIMEKPLDLAFAQATIKARIATTKGVSGIDNFTATVDRNIRSLFITASVQTIYGDTKDIKVRL